MANRVSTIVATKYPAGGVGTVTEPDRDRHVAHHGGDRRRGRNGHEQDADQADGIGLEPLDGVALVLGCLRGRRVDDVAHC